MGRGRLRTLLIAAAAIVVAVPVTLLTLRPAGLRNFGVVEPGVLYRSGQLTPAGLERVLAENQCRTVVSLRPVRDAGSNGDTWEEEWCRSRGVKHVRIPPGDETETEWRDRVAAGFLAVLDDPANHPVLVHCTAGRDRTGTMCAVYRMEYDRWPGARAAAEMAAYEFDPDKDAAAKAYEQLVLTYRPRWRRADDGKK